MTPSESGEGVAESAVITPDAAVPADLPVGVMRAALLLLVRLWLAGLPHAG